MIFDNLKDFVFIDKKLFDLKLRLKRLNLKLDYTVDYDKLKIVVKYKKFKSLDEIKNFIRYEIDKINSIEENLFEEKEKYDKKRNEKLKDIFLKNIDKANLKRIEDYFYFNEYSGISFTLEVYGLEKKFYLFFNDNPGLKEIYENYSKSLFNTKIIDFLKSKINEKDFLKNNIL